MARVDGSRIRELRQQQQRSVEQLAVEAGISPTTLRNIETGKTPRPKPPFIAAIAASLGVDVADLDQAEPAVAS